ncbi:MAG: ABC transporter ATP-binding protein [Ruminococcaceae bacterium]|nr:ABC transporter ATP-binding protein [Oscillospiraceae bacterium]
MSNEKERDNRPQPQMRPGKGVHIPGQKLDMKTAKRVIKYLMAYKWRLAVVVACIIFSALAGVYGSKFLKTLVDGYIDPLIKAQSTDLSGLLKEIIKLAVVYALGAFSTFAYNRIMAVVSQSVLKNIRDTMFIKMQTLPIKYFDTHSFGDTMSRYTNDTDTMRMMISMSFPQIVSSLCTVIAVFFAMLTTNIWLTLFVVLTAFLTMLLVKTIGGKSGKFFIKQQKSVGEVNGYIEEMINGQKVVQVFCREEKTKEGFSKLNDNLFENASNANIFANILGPVSNNLGHLQYILIATLGGLLVVLTESLTPGGLVAFLQLSKNFTNPINQITQQINSIIMAMAGAKRIFELMDEEPESDDGYVTLVNAKYNDNGELTETAERTGIWAWKHPHGDGTLTYTQLKGDVRMVEVDFGYTPEKTVLHDVTLYAEPGQKVAFVGATGAGKTTITNLINRFYDIADGKIRYDGININKIKKSDLRRSLGMVLQDTNLFTGTVMENIRYGRPDATDEECMAAARLANADGFISVLPDGYDTMLEGDGSGLSQGQRQLLAIARAAVADPPVMILDEATSSIDTRTEAIVQKGMDSLMHGRTVFVIAHRLSTVRNSDVIMVLDKGRIIERGNHEKLIAEKGQYYRLYTGAFELE